MDTQDKNIKRPANMLTTTNNTVAIYTVLTILMKMKATLGLEAMLEYIEKYLSTIEETHPDMKTAVARALGMMSIDKIYREATSSETK